MAKRALSIRTVLNRHDLKQESRESDNPPRTLPTVAPFRPEYYTPWYVFVRAVLEAHAELMQQQATKGDGEVLTSDCSCDGEINEPRM